MVLNVETSGHKRSYSFIYTPKMERKDTKDIRIHPERQKKRHFRGNRYTAEQDLEFASTSAKKLQSSKDIDFPVFG